MARRVLTATAMTRAALGRAALVVLLIAAVAIAFGHRAVLNADAVEAWVQSAGAWGSVLFMCVFVVATVLFLPGTVLALAGGALFGPVWGALYGLTGATLGAAAAFVIARYVAAGWVARKASGWSARLIAGVEAEGWRFAAFVRLVPLFPFNLLNYALGLTRIRLLPYVAATYVFMLPGAVAYTYLGYAGREAIGGGEDLIRKVVLAGALLGIVAFVPRWVRRIRAGTAVSSHAPPALTAAALKRRLDDGEPIIVLDVRTAADYANGAGHIANAKHIPLEELPRRWQELDAIRDAQLAIVCRTNRRSSQAVAQLRARGLRNVILVEDGMAGWERQGFPTER